MRLFLYKTPFSIQGYLDAQNLPQVPQKLLPFSSHTPSFYPNPSPYHPSSQHTFTQINTPLPLQHMLSPNLTYTHFYLSPVHHQNDPRHIRHTHPTDRYIENPFSDHSLLSHGVPLLMLSVLSDNVSFASKLLSLSS